ncbi:MAG: AAA family ATPase [Alphaproteobacteria bacterium]
MYETFYGLKRRPFSTLPDPEFIYWSKGHEMALTMLRYGVMTRAPITVITGEIGAGKTTLVRHLLNELPEDLTTGLVSNLQEGRGELLQWVLMALDQPVEAQESYVSLFRRFQDFVIQSYAAGRRVLLLIDEAQNLGVKMLEELRMLTNINSEGDDLLQLILVGQPQLRDLLNQPELVQFAQRITSDFCLNPLGPTETAAYIRRRLEIAGAEREIFTPRTCELIHQATGGTPRLINSLCDLCLVYGYSDNRHIVDEDLLIEFLNSAKNRGIYNQFRPIDPKPSVVGAAASG